MDEIRIEKQPPEDEQPLAQRLGLTPLMVLSVVSMFASLGLMAVMFSADLGPGSRIDVGGVMILLLPILAALVSTVSYFKASRR